MENFFEQFHGRELRRLIKCITKLEAEGLTTTRYTDAGINSRSGNLYVWDESWSACIFIGSEGSEPTWCYPCFECGEEHMFDTHKEAQEYAQTYDHQCESCNPKEREEITE